ncbi:MAG: hypothetical protein PHC34_11270 [Candidatus Gastranaerophilales bacterium]|nr:hypothetical protein [Candidatus Gastranaerophilales bacterium]
MNIASNNNLTFKSNISVEDIAALNNSDIKTVSKALARENNKKSSDTRRTVALGLLAGVPALDGIVTSARLTDVAMSTRTKEGLKRAGSYAPVLFIAAACFSLFDKAIQHSPKVHKHAESHPALYLLGSLGAAYGVVTATMDLVPKGAIYLAKKLSPITKKLVEKFDKFGLVDKTEEVTGSLKGKTRDLINKLNGGRIESGLNKVSNLLEKEVAGTRAEKLLFWGITAGVLSVFAKRVSDENKYSKEVKQNYNQLNQLRAHAREIVTINDEVNTTKELAILETEDIR